jgi:hypothetical protein
MIHHDLSHWPLVVTVASGASSLEELRDFTREWSAWLGRGERFATLRVFVDSDALAHPEGSAQEVKQWFQASREAIREQVLGMATVVPPTELERVRKMNAEKLFGVPAVAEGDIAQAIRWLSERAFAPNGLALDVARVLETVQGMMAGERRG